MGRPKQYPDRMELRLPDGWREELTALADRRGVPQAEEARIALARHLGVDYTDDDGGDDPVGIGGTRTAGAAPPSGDLGPF